MERKYILAIIQEVASEWYMSPKNCKLYKDIKEASIKWTAVEALIEFIEKFDESLGGSFEGYLDPIYVIFKFKKQMAEGMRNSHSSNGKYIFRVSMDVASDMLDIFEAAMR